MKIALTTVYFYVYEGGREGQNNLIKPNDQVSHVKVTHNESIL